MDAYERKARESYDRAVLMAASHRAQMGETWVPIAGGVMMLLFVIAGVVAMLSGRQEPNAPIFTEGQRVKIAFDDRPALVLGSWCRPECVYNLRISTPYGYDTIWRREFELVP